ncbi:porin family protein [Dokdonella soli]|uniref:Outer membrane protein beta-barrel domain-containing protein n=1 Tax=Dokdonella soli TaxID=529810 RepID=A0ABN1IQ26_9GAMM
MKNAVLAIALATAGLIALPAAHAADNSGFFVNGNIGQSNLSKGAYDDNDTGYAANVGYRWAVAPNLLLGVEGGYADLGSVSPKSAFNGAGLGDASIKGWTLGANGHFNVTDNWYVSGRAGFFRADLKGGYLGAAGLPVRVDDSSNKWYAGAGFGYDFSNNLSVGLNYDYYKADKNGVSFNPDLVSVSAEYRF